MRILYITDGDISKVNSAASHFFSMAKALLLQDCELKIVAPIYGFRGKTETIAGVEVTFLPGFIKNILGYFFFQIIQFFYLSKMVISGKYDLIYSRSGFFNIAPILISKLFGIPHVLELNGIIEDELRVKRRLNASLKIFRILNCITYRNVSKIVAVTEGIKAELIKRYKLDPHSIFVIPNGVNTKIFHKKTSKVREELLIPEEAIVFGFVGTFSYWQGIHILLDAIKDINETDKPIVFILVGASKEKSYQEALNSKLKELNNKNIFMTGRVDHDQVVDYINAFDICVAPFISERNEIIGLSPLKLFEYLSCAKPILTTAIPGVKDVVEQSNAGWVVKADDVVALSNGLKLAAAASPSTIEKMGENGRLYVVRNHDWNALAKQLKRIITV